MKTCQNCGIEKPLTKNHCMGCICLKCGKTAFEVGSSMNEVGWCDVCEITYQNITKPLPRSGGMSGRHLGGR